MKRILKSTLILFFLFNVSLRAQHNESHIDQVGNSHEAIIEQEVTTGSNGSYSGNFPGQGVNGIPPGIPFQESLHTDHNGSYAEILQFDTGNRAAIDQAGGHWAKIYQDGFQNIATVTQDGKGNGFSFNPPGVATPCPQPFSPCSASSDHGSVTSVYQEGDQNTAIVEQDLGSNEAKIIQYGSELEAIILQYGDSNYASILQDFRGSSILNSGTGFRTAEIEQTHSYNIATVEQSVPTSLPIEIIQNGNMEVHVEHH